MPQLLDVNSTAHNPHKYNKACVLCRWVSVLCHKQQMPAT